MNQKEPFLSLKGISKSFPIAGKRIPILKDISFDVFKEEWIGLMGPSGSGKTTLLSIIAGLIRPDRGKILWKGKHLPYFFDIYPAYLRNRHIGVIFQDFRLVESETVWENLILPLRIRGWYGKNQLDYAQWLLKKVGLETHKHHRAGLLSGGQKQRLSLARAFVIQPLLVLADEPFANLDEKTSEELLELLEILFKEQPFSMILVHHKKKLAKKCHKTYHLHEGRLELL
ncbi:ABC transporter ATP-binding protein [Thermospira aquatica]|uniref:ATP-binding cassette domain-containing protein n=1 Tax=Thermospira aquatica TaxID=2828656 RepID=A0AAX3BGA6_9SPIR|nr:ATP-binding cassette domain-containing protein [Thermospira aquatica]URA11256.1 ATP-binding cassette domain-containing protein [Thermospira aquatica]